MLEDDIETCIDYCNTIYCCDLVDGSKRVY